MKIPHNNDPTDHTDAPSIEVRMVGDGKEEALPTNLEPEDIESPITTLPESSPIALPRAETIRQEQHPPYYSTQSGTKNWHIAYVLGFLCLGGLLSLAVVYEMGGLIFFCAISFLIMSFYSQGLEMKRGDPLWFKIVVWIVVLPMLLLGVAVALVFLIIDFGALPGTLYLMITVDDVVFRVIAGLVLLPVSIATLSRRILLIRLICQSRAAAQVEEDPEEEDVSTGELELAREE